MADEEEVRCTLRISRDLRDKVSAAAETNSRSLNGEIEFRIDDYDRIVSLLKQASADGVIDVGFGLDANAAGEVHELRQSVRRVQSSSAMTLDLVKEQGDRIEGISGDITTIRRLLEGALGRALTGG